MLFRNKAISDTCIAGILLSVFIPSKEPKYRTVSLNTGHLATLTIISRGQSWGLRLLFRNKENDRDEKGLYIAA